MLQTRSACTHVPGQALNTDQPHSESNDKSAVHCRNSVAETVAADAAWPAHAMPARVGHTLEPPWSESCSTCVSLLFLYGMWGSPACSAAMTSPRADRDLLMLCASLSTLPVALLRPTRSDPARSSRLSRVTTSLTPSVCVIRSVTSSWLRLLCSFMSVTAVARLLRPVATHSCTPTPDRQPLPSCCPGEQPSHPPAPGRLELHQYTNYRAHACPQGYAMHKVV